MGLLAALRRRLQPRVEIVATENHVFYETFKEPRPVVKVQGNAITLLTQMEQGPVESWLYFPSASQVEYDEETSVFRILEEDDPDRRHLMEYRIL